MHVLIIPSWYPKFPGDIQGSFFRQQGLALKRFGHQVGVIDIKLRLPRSWKQLFNGFFGDSAEVDEGLFTYRFCGMDWFRRIPRLQSRLWLRYGMKLFERYVLLHGKPDLIHAHAMFYGGVLAKEISERFDIPFVVTEHSTGFARGLVSKQQMDLALGVAISAERLFAVSDEFCKLLDRQFGCEKILWEEMPNVVDQKFLNKELPILRTPNKPFTFLNVAFSCCFCRNPTSKRAPLCTTPLPFPLSTLIH